jgi:hypothetical protein
MSVPLYRTFHFSLYSCTSIPYHHREVEIPAKAFTIISVTWLTALRGKTDRGYYKLYFTKESNLKEGKIGPIKSKFFNSFLLSIFYLPLFNSLTKEFLG